MKMKIGFPKLLLIACAACLGLAATSCQTRGPLVLQAVGPPSASGPLDFVGTGFLKVYSATEARQGGKFITYYPHTPYIIYRTNGQALRWVQNSATFLDENPALASLPAGLYTIRAKDDDYGRVTIPVAIKGGETTVIHLEDRKLPTGERIDPTQAVRLPNGRPIGVQANRS